MPRALGSGSDMPRSGRGTLVLRLCSSACNLPSPGRGTGHAASRCGPCRAACRGLSRATCSHVPAGVCWLGHPAALNAPAHVPPSIGGHVSRETSSPSGAASRLNLMLWSGCAGPTGRHWYGVGTESANGARARPRYASTWSLPPSQLRLRDHRRRQGQSAWAAGAHPQVRPGGGPKLQRPHGADGAPCVWSLPRGRS